MNKMKNESKLNKLFRNNKSIFMLAFFFVFLAVGVWAGTTISNDEIITTGNVTTANINQVWYVDAGDVTDIQTKINLCSTTGCNVVITAGSYNTSLLDSPINLTDNLILSCQEGANIFRDSEVHMLNASKYISNFTLKGCTFDAGDNAIVNTAPILFADGGENLNFYDNTFTNSFENHYLFLGGVSNNPANNVKIEDNDFLNVESGIHIFGNNFQANNNYFESRAVVSGGAEYGEAIDHNGGNGSIISNNHILNFQEDGIDANANNSIVFGNVITLSDNGEITNGIKIGPNSSVYGNVILNVQGADTGIRAPQDNVVISNNLIIGNGTGTGILLDASNINLVNNKVFNVAINLDDNGANNGIDGAGNRSHFLEQILITGADSSVNLKIQETDPRISLIDTNAGDVFLYLNSGFFEIRQTDADDTFGTRLFSIDQSSGAMIVGNGTVQANITLTSPDGAEHECGVNNAGSFVCT